MVFSAEDKILIKELKETKGYGARRLITEFPTKNWSLAGVSKLLKKIATTGSVARKPLDRALRTQTKKFKCCRRTGAESGCSAMHASVDAFYCLVTWYLHHLI